MTLDWFLPFSELQLPVLKGKDDSSICLQWFEVYMRYVYETISSGPRTWQELISTEFLTVGSKRSHRASNELTSGNTTGSYTYIFNFIEV